MSTVGKHAKATAGVALAVLVGGGVVAAPAASASAPEATADRSADDARSASAEADITGDGGPELITIREREATHVISARFADHSYVESAFPADSTARLALEPRVADLDRDGAAEIVTATQTGANTITYNAFTYVPERGLVRMTDSDGAPFTFHDGGGAMAEVSYGCYGPDSDGAAFRVVRAERSDDDSGFHGVRTTYRPDGDTMVRSGQTSFHGVDRDDPAMQADPRSCEPV